MPEYTPSTPLYVELVNDYVTIYRRGQPNVSIRYLTEAGAKTAYEFLDNLIKNAVAITADQPTKTNPAVYIFGNYIRLRTAVDMIIMRAEKAGLEVMSYEREE